MMKKAVSVYNEMPFYAFFKSLTVPSLRPAALRCAARIIYNFFFRQWLAAWLPGRVPVNRVDHPLDKKIPFVPSWVTVYLDFIFFWVRMASFLLHFFGRRAITPVKEFIDSMGRLYIFVAECYSKNFSTTDRPFYIARPRFFLIHLADPHLMCLPSLHVMVVMWTYTRFAAILRSLSKEERYVACIEEMKQGALAITRAILFVKQHSVNCIPAALYAMTRFDPGQFPAEKMEAFANLLFNNCENAGSIPVLEPEYVANIKNRNVHPGSTPKTMISPADEREITGHIIRLYRQFIAEGKTSKTWEEPLMNFMRQLQRK